MKINEKFKVLIAFTEKELKKNWRYKYYFLMRIIADPILSMIPFLLIYSGLFYSETLTSLGDITQSNYLSWLFLGSLFHSFAFQGFIAFENRFLTEKFWMTIEGSLLAPISKYYILFGIIVEISIESSISFLILTIFSYIFYPTNFFNIILIFIILFLTLLGTAGIGLIEGAFIISNEDYRFFFKYLYFILIFFSCYTIPYVIFPSFLQPLVIINPLYHSVSLIRSIWFNTVSFDNIISLINLLVFTTLSLLFSVMIFNKIWKKFGLKGY
ncbi:MAG: ABC transporter permease [Candidatus Helarchaeota archaeon]